MLKRFPVTVLLIASLLALYAIEWTNGAFGNDAQLMHLGALSDAAGPGSDLWRLLTYAWLHAGPMHLLTNLALLAWAGRIVERRVGRLATLGVYLAGALAGGALIAAKAAMAPKPGTSVGASAAISALLAAALVLLHRPGFASFGQPRGVRLALWAILGVGLAASLLPGVSLAGHAGGLVAGAALGFLMPARAHTAAEGAASPPAVARPAGPC